MATYNAAHPDAVAVSFASPNSLLRDVPLPAQPGSPTLPHWVSQSLRLSYSLVLGVVLLVALMTGFVAAYLRQFDPALYAAESRLILLALLVALCVFGLKIGAMLLGINLTALQFGFISLLCITAVAMLITVLLEPYVALVVAALLSLLSTLILGNELRYCLMTYVASLVAVLSVSAVRTRTDMLRAGCTMALANVVLTFLLGQVTADSWATIGVGTLWGAVAGLLSVALVSIGVALFEKPFGLTTHLGLLELIDPNRPLLLEFSRACPGTYAHSVSVGNLASAAAEAIGADALLCRVSAYYHDIGKIRRPEFFVENQTGVNIHERLDPSLSALVVVAHVKEGVEIAEKAKLPPAVRDIILQHHGTSLIRYFYHRAAGGCATGTEAEALEDHYRYPGPKPSTLEAAIMMLADSVEAASHVLYRPTPQRIDELVRKVIEDKQADGQFDDAPITLHDLATIRTTFVRVLSGMLHSRVEYPDMLIKVNGGIAPQPVEVLLENPGAIAVEPSNVPKVRSTRVRSPKNKLPRNAGKLLNDEPSATSGNGDGQPREPLYVTALSSDAASPAASAPGDRPYC
ncbi:MAG: HDIG domain-containing protein [Capsulimonadaceae bacterium]|nr:HDIG domain-containing protein [Capsulimonadaceae bacterium]